MIIKKILFIFLIIFNFNAHSFENKILFKIDNDIITSLDIYNEVNYLTVINKNIQKLDKNKIYEIAKNAIIRDKIKKKQILKILKKEIDLDQNYIDQLVKSTALKFGYQSKVEFEKYMISSGIKMDIIDQKISLEILWNELIFQKYSSQIVIDKKKILDEIKSNNKNIKSFLLSEILINMPDGVAKETIFDEIEKNITVNGFENAALIHSVSSTSSSGGKLGWIKENAMNNKIRQKILKLKIGEHTKPMVVPGGFLIIKIEEIKKVKIKININEEMDKLIVLKKNQQLNQFSNIYYNKIKKDFKIDEL